MIVGVFTVLTGVLIFVIGQFLQELLIKPYQQYFDIETQIVSLISFYSNMYGINLKEAPQHTIDKVFKGSDELRICASNVLAFIQRVPLVHPGIPSKEKLYIIHQHLIGLSNSFSADTVGEFKDIRESEREIYRILNLYKVMK